MNVIDQLSNYLIYIAEVHSCLERKLHLLLQLILHCRSSDICALYQFHLGAYNFEKPCRLCFRAIMLSLLFFFLFFNAPSSSLSLPNMILFILSLFIINNQIKLLNYPKILLKNFYCNQTPNKLIILRHELFQLVCFYFDKSANISRLTIIKTSYVRRVCSNPKDQKHKTQPNRCF